MNRLDVLHVIDSLGEGGAENNLLSILRRLPADRFRNHIAWLHDRETLVEALRPHVTSFVPLHAPRSKRGLLAAAAALNEWLQIHRPSVVHAQLLMAHLVSRIASRSANVPQVTTWQNVVYDNTVLNDFGGSSGRREFLLSLDRQTASWDSAFIAVSQHVARRWVETLGVPAERVTVIPNAVEPDRYRDCTPDEIARTRAALGLPDDAELLLSVGRLVATKGHLESIAAMPAILARRPRAHLLIAGSGPLEAELRGRAAALGGRVRILGQRGDLPCLYGLADAFLFATHYEGLSLALVELISAGLPGAISDIPPNHEVAGGLPTIRFFSVGDVEGLARAVVAVLEGGAAGKAEARALRHTIAGRHSPDLLSVRVAAVLEGAAREIAMRRALYVSHTGMSEPLGRSQVVPYLRGLARAGWRIDVVAFEPPSEGGGADLDSVRRELAADGIGYSFQRRSPSHALPVKLAEAAQAFARLLIHALSEKPRIVHARSHLPAMAALALTRALPGVRLLFDCRGLLADEYVDAGHWRAGSLQYRLVKRAERLLFARADGVVTLTERLRQWLSERSMLGARAKTAVIPCCVDLDRFSADEAARARSRQALGAADRFVLAYSGSLNSWYCEEQMARLFAQLRRLRPSLFAIFTRSPAERLRAALFAAGVPETEVRISAVAPSEMPARLCGADAAVSFIQPCFSKMASSPTKVAEYLALGLPVALNRGVGDLDQLLGEPAVVDAGAMSDGELERAAARLASLGGTGVRGSARALARRDFSVAEVGVVRYRELYERLAS